MVTPTGCVLRLIIPCEVAPDVIDNAVMERAGRRFPGGAPARHFEAHALGGQALNILVGWCAHPTLLYTLVRSRYRGSSCSARQPRRRTRAIASWRGETTQAISTSGVAPSVLRVPVVISVVLIAVV